MAGLLIKNLPARLHQQLRERARRNRRSMSAEVITILERVLVGESRPDLARIDERRVRPARPVDDALIARGKREGRP